MAVGARALFERAAKQVEGDGSVADRVRLYDPNGQVVETWQPPFDVAECLSEYERRINEQRMLLPPRQFQMQLQSFDAQERCISTFTATVRGESREAANIAEASSALSLARAQEAQVKTLENLLAIVNGQMDRIARQNESLSNAWEKLLGQQMEQNAKLVASLAKQGEALREELKERENLSIGLDPELKEMAGMLFERLGAPIVDKFFAGKELPAKGEKS